MERLEELSKQFFEHPEEGGDFLSALELMELCRLQRIEVERLRAFLPQTADRVAVGIGSVVWHSTRGQLEVDYGEQERTGGCHTYIAVPEGEAGAAMAGVPIRQCFSAQAAAKAAGGEGATD